MSVAQLSAKEIATFAAICHHLELLDYPKLLPLCEVITAGNCAAWAATYSDTIEPVDADDLERDLLHALADPESLVDNHFGPVRYNMIANNGRAFAGLFAEVGQDDEFLVTLEKIEKQCSDWQDGKRREKQRGEENAVAFNDVGQLPTITGQELAAMCEAAKCQRVIIAEFHVNESDCYTDYFSSRSARKVVIGFGKGSRENFKQLRKAAAQFKPTEHLGPDRDQFEVGLIWDHNHQDDPERAFIGFNSGNNPGDLPRVDQSVNFHYFQDDFEATHGRWGFAFGTQADCDAFIAANEPPAGTNWNVRRESYEHRECYSMGAGNWLGTDSYSGWQVTSENIKYAANTETIEFCEPEKPAPKRQKAASGKQKELAAHLTTQPATATVSIEPATFGSDPSDWL